ncbi:MAG: hypothetical protein V3T17_05335 [Pseudomonadales bacterium]
MKCWAKNVSDCCSTQSREHYITKGLFSDKDLYLYNAPFLGGQSKKISKASMTRKCLCKRHNELLSIYDDEAIKFSNALVYCKELSWKRRKSNAKRFSVHKKEIDRDRFCRWFLKTYLGLSEFFEYPSEINEDILANFVYSKTKITDHIHFQVNMTSNEEFDIVEKVSVAPIQDDDKTIGMQIELYGLRISGRFSENPLEKQKPLKIRFNEYKQGLSCMIRVK